MPAVGRDIPHDSAGTHVTGESIFIDDMPPAHGELLVDTYGSLTAHGTIRSIDLAAAREVPGVVALYTAADVKGHLRFGPVLQDEDLLAHEEVMYVGHPIVIIAATSRRAINIARQKIVVQIDELPPIFTIDEAVADDSFIGPLRTIERGDVATAIAAAPHTLSGQLIGGGQEHFYLESQAAIAIPGEGATMTIHSSTQHPTEVQGLVAEVLGVPFNAVSVVCKRMGGGFGGKETQAAQPAMFAAIVASFTNRPTRVVYTKDDDMAITGKRHPINTHWTIGFDERGRIHGLQIDYLSNGGCSADLSLAVMERAMLHTDNAYFLPHVRITGRVCRTNLPSNTAFRGFGGPQGCVNIENILESIATELGIDSIDVRRANLYGIDDRNVTPYGQLVKNNTLHGLFDQLEQSSDYRTRREQITKFNGANRTQLRGLSMTAVKFGISFTKQHLNQANALVNIYTDGTVLVTTGGTEMGQGLNTRVRQIVADELGVPYEHVRIGATDTSKNNNTSPTAASSGTDLNGAAAVDACSRLRSRLVAFAATLLADNASGLHPSPGNIVFADGEVWDDRRPGVSFKFREIVVQTYLARVNLGERGFYATPGVDYNRDTGKGTPFLYYTNGACASEVLIDRLTGEVKVTRVDLLMDVGLPINPGLDRGQVVGAFIQGMGWVTNEELKYSAKGELLSHSPTTYKIPNIGDVPPVFNVAFFDNPDNHVSLKRSKAIGEPPLVLGLSVWTAVKDALRAVSPKIAEQLKMPATSEEVLMLLPPPCSARPAATEPSKVAVLRSPRPTGE
ncbi:MAG TPA: xanthine dehydrogenase molybdopterin binding subunit [Tepidisphaeraceae bacterium]|jgi:xanthine dehydrogenase large subunit|nr:xanthine dehydrogenase molybdopterin binding subunit [Tepidisphaeraceae bacterium]